MRQSRVIAAVMAATACLWIATLVLSFRPGSEGAAQREQTCKVTNWGWTEEEAGKVFPFPPLSPCVKPRSILTVSEQRASLACEPGEQTFYLLPPKEELSANTDFESRWRLYNSPIDISQHTFIYASCDDLHGNVVYDAFVHATAAPLDFELQKTILAGVDERFGGHSQPMKIFVVSLDSVGRNSFFRNFKRTAQLLQAPSDSIWTYDFQQLNVMGLASRENVIPLLTGLKSEELKRLRLENEDWEDRSLWQIFKAFGFRTVLGLENHVCDFCDFFGHDIHPTKLFLEFYRTATGVENFQAYSPGAHCIAGRNSHTYLLDFMLSYASLFEAFPVFQYAHVHPGHEPTQQVVKLADEDISAFIQEVERRYSSDPYLIVLMADHGHSYQYMASYANNDKWALEYKVPSLFFRFNSAFRDIVGATHMARNTERLVSPIDIYVTLAQVAMSNAFPRGSHEMMELAEALSAYNTGSEQFRSLFLEEVPATRTCWEVGIPAIWCSCLQFADARPQQHVISFALEEMNRRTNAAPYCRQISVARLQFFKALIDHNITYFSMEFVPEADLQASFYAIVSETEAGLALESMQRMTPYEQVCQQLIRLDLFNDSPDPAFCLCEELSRETYMTVYERVIPYRYLFFVLLAEAGESCSQVCASIHKVCVAGLFPLINECQYLSDRLDDEHKTPRVLPCTQAAGLTAPLLKAGEVVLSANWTFSCEAREAEGQRICPCVWR